MHTALLPGPELINEVQLIRDIITAWSAAMDGLVTDGSIIRALAQVKLYYFIFILYYYIFLILIKTSYISY